MFYLYYYIMRLFGWRIKVVKSQIYFSISDTNHNLHAFGFFLSFFSYTFSPWGFFFKLFSCLCCHIAGTQYVCLLCRQNLWIPVKVSSMCAQQLGTKTVYAALGAPHTGHNLQLSSYFTAWTDSGSVSFLCCLRCSQQLHRSL